MCLSGSLNETMAKANTINALYVELLVILVDA